LIVSKLKLSYRPIPGAERRPHTMRGARRRESWAEQGAPERVLHYGIAPQKSLPGRQFTGKSPSRRNGFYR